jgi:hypothetical protein
MRDRVNDIPVDRLTTVHGDAAKTHGTAQARAAAVAAGLPQDGRALSVATVFRTADHGR